MLGVCIECRAFGCRVAGVVVWWRGGDCVFFMANERGAW